jgi:chemotaxis protein methyltransferase CheR
MNETNITREFDLHDSDFASIVKIVHEKTGIKLADHKRSMVYSRLAKRLRELNFDNFAHYLDFLCSEDGNAESVNFINAVTTNLTSFFREKHHFEHLKQLIKTTVAKNPAQKKIRIWSCASSSGQEPYSIAMTLCDAIPNIAQWDIKILATDIDTNMLHKCKTAIYKEEALEDIPEEYRKRFTIKSEKETILMADILRKMITFKQLNLLEDFPMRGPFDIIFCRNVVIYFDKPTQIGLFNKIADILTPDGILYIGHSESLFKVCEQFSLIGRTTYKKLH